MPNHQIPLFLSNDPAQVEDVSDDGSRFTIRLTPPIFIPARRLDGSNVVPTISARSVDIINSMHNVSLQHKNHEFLMGVFAGTTLTSLQIVTIENGVYSLNELANAINTTLAAVMMFSLGLAPLSIKNRIQLTLGSANHAIIVTPDTYGLPLVSIGDTQNNSCRQQMTISCSCHSFNFVDERAFTNVITLSSAAISKGNRATMTPTDLVVSLTIPNSSTKLASVTNWASKHASVGIKNKTKFKTFDKSDLSKAHFRTTWVDLQTKLDNGLAAVATNLIAADTSVSIHLTSGEKAIKDLFGKLQSNVNVYQDEFGNFLGIEIYLSFHGGEHDNIVSNNLHYTMCSMFNTPKGSSELLCAMNDTFNKDIDATHLQLGSTIDKLAIPYLYNISAFNHSRLTHYQPSEDHTHSHNRVFVHVSSASRLMDTNEDKSTKFTSVAMNNSASLPHHDAIDYYYPYPLGFGNNFGKLLGLYTISKKIYTYQNIGGAYNVGEVTVIVANGAAQFDHASTLHLSCSIASGSIGSDGHGGRGIICSWPMSQVAQGAHASIMYSTPIEVPCRMAGMNTDRITFTITDVVGERPHLSGERLLVNVVIAYDT